MIVNTVSLSNKLQTSKKVLSDYSFITLAVIEICKLKLK